MSIKEIFACCSLALVLAACGTGDAANANNETSTDIGTSIYTSSCVMCHGRDGNLGMSGATDLTKSMLTKDEMIAVVTNGRGGMIGFKTMLSKQEIDEVVEHVRTLHITQ